jgi:membrane-associated phospholipid phosphatase
MGSSVSQGEPARGVPGRVRRQRTTSRSVQRLHHVIGDIAALNRAVRDWTLAHQNPIAHQAFAWASAVGSFRSVFWMSVLVALYLVVRGRRRGVVACLLAPLLALPVYTGIRRFYPHARPPSIAGLAEATSSFPSAHSTASTAVYCTLAYVLWREKMLSAPVSLAVAIVPSLLIGVSRVYLDVHWATDVIGGWVAGILIATLARLAYNWSRAWA